LGIFHNWKVQENDSFLAGPGMWWKYVNFNKKKGNVKKNSQNKRKWVEKLNYTYLSYNVK